MKANDILTTYEKLFDLKEKKLPVKVAFIISRNMAKMKPIAEELNEKRMEIIREYAEKKENGDLNVNEEGNVKINDMQAFSNTLKELFDSDLDLTLDKLYMADVERCDQEGFDSLTVEEMSVLECMIENEADMVLISEEA